MVFADSMNKNKQRPFIQAIGGIGLATLVFAGAIKGTDALSWVPIDLTLGAAMLVAASVAICGVQGALDSRLSPRFIIPIVLWIVFLFPLLESGGGEYGLQKVLTLFTVTLLCGVAPFTILAGRAGQIAFLASIIFIALLAASGTLLGSQSNAYEYSNRLALEGSTTITTARMVGAGVLLTFLASFAPIPKLWRLLGLLASPLLLYVGLTTGSRGPVFAAAISLVVTLLVSKRLRRHRIQGFIAAGFIVLLGAYQALRSGSDGLARVLTFLSGDDTGGASGRDVIYQATIEKIIENPWGIGWGRFSEFGHPYPHNFLLEIALEGGIFVAMIVLAYLVVAAVRLYRASGTLIGTGFLNLYVFAFLNAMVSSDINGNKLLWVTMFSAFVFGELRSGAREPSMKRDPNTRGSPIGFSSRFSSTMKTPSSV